MHLPTGTVTLLFTDIQGSTRLLERMGDGYAGVVRDHHTIVRAAIARHGGRELRTVGDSFFVVFAEADQAILAAADLQRDLAAHSWPGGEEVLVRVGMDKGEPRSISRRCAPTSTISTATWPRVISPSSRAG
jgi:class 3 adenylate cyclase